MEKRVMFVGGEFHPPEDVAHFLSELGVRRTGEYCDVFRHGDTIVRATGRFRPFSLSFRTCSPGRGR